MLTNNKNGLSLYNAMQKMGENISLYSDVLSVEQILNFKPAFLISYNYIHIIKKEIINIVESYGGKIINLHISYLPWNRGFSPNIWSFIDNTPKGITIHYIDEGLDTGNILLQKEIFFDEKKETFISTYNTLNEEIQKLFKSNWECIKNKSIEALPQNSSKGSYHCLKDLIKLQECIKFSWADNIYEFKKRLHICNSQQ